MTGADLLPDNDFDGPWKEVLDLYLEEAIAFFFPAAHADIDWSRGYHALDKELQQVAPDGERAAQAVDKLIQVVLRDGTDTWVLIHLEVQSQPEREFAERMFRYHTRLYDRYRQEIVSLAVLGDERAAWRPDSFGYGRWGSMIRFTFPAIKLLDFSEEELASSPNLCAIIVLAHRTAQATRHDPTGRAAAKLGLVRRLYQRGLTREQIRDLYRFIDWLLRLPQALEDQTWLAIKAFEEEQAMPYITYAERRGMEHGLQEGIAQGQLTGLLTGLEVSLNLKFGAAGAELLPLLRQIEDAARLKAILQRLQTVASLDELRTFAE